MSGSQSTPTCRRSLQRWLVVASLSAMLFGCTTITTHKSTGEEIEMTPEEFEHYTEHVFRFQNKVMNDLIEAAEDRADLDHKDAQMLDAAEQRMVTTCQLLNEIVSESMSGENPGFKLKMDLVDSVPACEEASQAVHDLIP